LHFENVYLKLTTFLIQSLVIVRDLWSMMIEIRRGREQPVKQKLKYKIIMSNKLFVGNLSFGTTEGDLKEIFSKHGNVTEVNIIMDRMTGRSRGFAFVTMDTPEAGRAAIAALNGHEFDGRAFTVNEARPREEGGGGRREGGGGGFGGGRREGGGGGGGGGKRRDRDFNRR
jgi:cold-inducible RNA-binding protein